MAWRIIYFMILFALVCNIIIVAVSGITGINIYKKYGMEMLKAFWKLMLFITAIYIAVLIGGLIP